MKAPARQRSDASVGIHACSCAVVPGPSPEQRGRGDTAAPTGLAMLIWVPQATPSRERALHPSTAPRLCVAERHRPAGSRPHVCARVCIQSRGLFPQALLPCPVGPSGGGVGSQHRLCIPGSWARPGRNSEALPSFVTSGTTLWTREDPSP